MRRMLTKWSAWLAVGVLAGATWSSSAGAGTSTAVTTSLLPGTISAGRFVKDFTLDGGAFRVVPAPAVLGSGVVPPAIATEAWATSQVQGYSMRGIAFGLVTIVEKFEGVRAARSQPAWVGLVQYDSERIQCPVMFAPFKKAPPSSGWAAVVLGVGSNPPAVVYIANYLRCGDLFHARLVNASETISLPWRADQGGALVSIPVCAAVTSEMSGSSGSRPPDFAIWATRLDDPTAPGCRAARTQLIVGGTADVASNPRTTHDPTGPVRMVNAAVK